MGRLTERGSTASLSLLRRRTKLFTLWQALPSLLIAKARDGEPRCCPKESARKIPRSIHEGARDIAKTDAYRTSRRERKKVEMLFARLKRILRLDRLRLRGPCGARDEFLLAATAQNLRKLAKLIPAPQPITAT